MTTRQRATAWLTDDNRWLLVVAVVLLFAGLACAVWLMDPANYEVTPGEVRLP